MTAPAKLPALTAGALFTAPPRALGGNTPWAIRYAEDIKDIITRHVQYSPRSLQRHLGPSEIGASCDRQVVGKMAGLPTTNHVADPWPSFMGTAAHAEMAHALEAENVRLGWERYLCEIRVVPHPNHAGTSDVYDVGEQAVVDHKFLGETTHPHISSGNPPRRYFVQLLFYAVGNMRAGRPVKRVVLIAYPRTKSTMDNLYVWDHPITQADWDLLREVFEQTARRQKAADEVLSGRADIRDIDIEPEQTECYFCPFYRPQSERDGGIGCPGIATNRHPKG